ncbi:AraC family transcriptional regulator [Lysinibacillus sp. NPDC096418]|uniref:AraC family transcriptional regulator n=1 Tax=Lysinibacillus sp. NPDC096418 TaxID=3364138 RepID=UPI003816A397
MANNNHINMLFHAYQSGSLIVHSTIAVNINAAKSLNYQTMTSALMFPIKGEATIQLDNQSLLAKPGKMIYIPYATNIKISVLSKENFSYINIFHQLIKRPLFEMEISNIFDEAYKLLIELVRLSKSTESKKLLQENIQTEKLFTLLQSQKKDLPICDYTIVKDLIHYINNHYHEDFNLEKLATLANVEKSKISYLFKKYTDKRPINYLIDYRLKIALELLETTDLLICEIAERVGYKDHFYFSRLFKKHIGICPSAVRLRSPNR